MNQFIIPTSFIFKQLYYNPAMRMICSMFVHTKYTNFQNRKFYLFLNALRVQFNDLYDVYCAYIIIIKRNHGMSFKLPNNINLHLLRNASLSIKISMNKIIFSNSNLVDCGEPLIILNNMINSFFWHILFLTSVLLLHSGF